MKLTIICAGLSSLQDAGRFGFEAYGVSQGGFADPDSAALANRLLDNASENPCIEICESRFELSTDCAIQIVCFGAWVQLGVRATGSTTTGSTTIGSTKRRSVAPGKAFTLAAGESLQVERWLAGRTLYLAFAGQLQLTTVLGSFCTDLANQFGGLAGRMLKNGDLLPVQPNHSAARSLSAAALPIPIWSGAQTHPAQALRFLAANPDLAAQLAQKCYQLSHGLSRAALRLSGPALIIAYELSSALSTGVVPGTIQVLPNGEPLVLGIDAQTLGGYARAGCVIQADLALLAQLKVGAWVQFECVDWQAAERINRDYLRRRARQFSHALTSNSI